MATFESCFQGKRVLVTGAGKGVGRALVKKFSELGAKVYAVSRTKADLDSLTAECSNVHPIVLDISDWDNTRTTLNTVVNEPVDILVNNAGVIIIEPFMKVTSDSFNTMVGTNLKATVNISQICVQKMIDARVGGTIINISSAYSLKPSAVSSIYCTTKSAIDTLTKTMAMELGQHQINVVAMNLGYVWTDSWIQSTGTDNVDEFEKQLYTKIGHQFPLGKIFIPMDQVLNSILFVASGSANMMTGNGFTIDGGYSAN